MASTLTVTDPSDNSTQSFTAETDEAAQELADAWLLSRHPETNHQTGDLAS